MRQLVQVTLLVPLVALWGCGGTAGFNSRSGFAEVRTPAQEGTSTNASTENAGAKSDRQGALTLSEVFMLPFEARLGKLLALTGLSIEAPEIKDLLLDRYQLGDFDHAQKYPPDFVWNTPKILRWTRDLLPVCHSQSAVATMRSAPLDKLIEGAWGRPVNGDDLSVFTAAGLIGADRKVSTEATASRLCIVIAGSLDFVAAH